MSVAFRRESDDEHLEPRFELPIPAGPNLVTARGRALIDERIALLEASLPDAADEEAAKPPHRRPPYEAEQTPSERRTRETQRRKAAQGAPDAPLSPVNIGWMEHSRISRGHG